MDLMPTSVLALDNDGLYPTTLLEDSLPLLVVHAIVITAIMNNTHAM
jgi:hypothetical protein